MFINREILKNAPISDSKPNEVTVNALKEETKSLTQDEFDKFAETLPTAESDLKQEVLDALNEEGEDFEEDIPESDFDISEEFEKSLEEEPEDF